VTTALERRVEALEAASPGDGGCDRCSGTLVVVSNVIAALGDLPRFSGRYHAHLLP
jgi:hypothetical protein